MSPPALVLSMIVKDEAHVIERCLASVRPLLSAWVVVDTGSRDDTPAVVERALAGLPGAVHSRPWRGFGPSRSEALRLAREQGGDYALVIDADDVLEFTGDFRLPPLACDAYRLPLRLGELRYRRVQLLRLAKPWFYAGVLHEYPECREPFTTGDLEGIEYVCHRDGARSRDPAKYVRDAAVLEQALVTAPGNTRYAFYLAQSYRDAGDDRRALQRYRHRAQMGGWPEEVFVALLEAARAADRLGEPPEAVWAAYLRAHQHRPTRAEPLYELARYSRERKDYALAWLFAGAAVQTPRPADILFIQDDVYRWRVHDEYALAAHFTGRHALAAEVNERLLAEGLVPESDRARVRDNLAWARRALEG